MKDESILLAKKKKAQKLSLYRGDLEVNKFNSKG